MQVIVEVVKWQWCFVGSDVTVAVGSGSGGGEAVGEGRQWLGGGGSGGVRGQVLAEVQIFSLGNVVTCLGPSSLPARLTPSPAITHIFPGLLYTLPNPLSLPHNLPVTRQQADLSHFPSSRESYLTFP